ncbi:MAG: biosynthetic arginine decarboxylase [Candidatus Porifericomitaceae bacterium WSBS_2022_MAG_OTU9]
MEAPNWAAAARERYRLPDWAEGYFDILADGVLAAKLPAEDGTTVTVSLPAIAADAMALGLNLPLMVRFPSILSDRLRRLDAAFAAAVAARNPKQQYRIVYPVKANQQHAVVATILRSGLNCGLEVGSKAELLLALALAGADNAIVCNGCKDDELLRLALTGSSLGLDIFIVVESLAELQHVVQLTQAMGIMPLLGFRLRLNAVASGTWQSTGGYKSKFGLGPTALQRGIDMLRQAGLLDCLRLAHFHIGSQVPDINAFSNAIREGCRYYNALSGMGAPLQYMDVGGGLAVDYDGTASTGNCSSNYSMEQYAHTIVAGIQSVCGDAVDPPIIMMECGRALTAHHAMVITSVVGVEALPEDAVAASQSAPAPHLAELSQRICALPASGAAAMQLVQYAKQCWQQSNEMFSTGKIGMLGLSEAEKLYRMAFVASIQAMKRAGIVPPSEIVHSLSLRVLCNFSVFQTLPDAWALGQIFPILPLHGLDEAELVDVTLHDLTCDSDGRVNSYVCSSGTSSTMPLPALAEGSWPLLGFFMLGAYQEVLGDVHNLFGNEASVSVVPDGDGYKLANCVNGDTAADLLAPVQLEPQQLLQAYQAKIKAAGLASGDSVNYMELFRRGLHGYTYMQTPPFPGIGSKI